MPVWQPDNAGSPLHLKGLEALFAMVRQPYDPAASAAARTLTKKLALWAIAGAFVKAATAALSGVAFAAQVTVELRDHVTIRSMEEGFRPAARRQRQSAR